jgi:predicted ribosome quality control (RQC) complex YloA/Tae2 family protein
MREYLSSTGVVIKVGQNAQENDSLVKTSHQDYVWCHLENQPSPHAVIEDPNPDTSSINEALQLVKYFSRARSTQQARIIVCKIRDLIRVDQSHPGLVQLKKNPTKKSARTDISILRRFGIVPFAN